MYLSSSFHSCHSKRAAQQKTIQARSSKQRTATNHSIDAQRAELWGHLTTCQAIARPPRTDSRAQPSHTKGLSTDRRKACNSLKCRVALHNSVPFVGLLLRDASTLGLLLREAAAAEPGVCQSDSWKLEMEMKDIPSLCRKSLGKSSFSSIFYRKYLGKHLKL